MATIAQLLAKIKTAIYGEEVRGSIHDAIEQCYADVTNGVTLAQTAATQANTARDAANTAATQANTARDAANTAATQANTARDAANDAADYAISETDAAIEQITDQVEYQLHRFDDVVSLGYPSEQGSGSIVGVQGTIDAPYSDIVIYGKSVQNGTPSPSAPVEIQTAGSGGTIPIVGAGRNLLPVIFVSGTNNSVIFTALSDGSVIANGTPTTATGLVTAITPLLPAGQYIVTGCPPGGSWGSVNKYRIRIGMENGTYINDEIGNGYTIQLESSQKLQLQINIGVGYTANNLVFRPMIRLASDTDATFAPYVGTAASLPTPNGLPGIPVSSGGNYTDSAGQQWICDEIDLGRGKHIAYMPHVIDDISGSDVFISEGNTSSSDGYRVFGIPYATYTGRAQTDATNGVFPCYCTHFVFNQSFFSNKAVGSCVYHSVKGNNSLIFYVSMPYADGPQTVAEFKEWWAENGVEAIIPILVPIISAAVAPERPIENDLTDAQLAALKSIRTHSGSSTIYTTDPAQPEMDVTGFIDIPTYIQKLLSENS